MRLFHIVISGLSGSTIFFHFVSQTARFSVKSSFIHLVVCLTTVPKPLPKPALHIVRSRASSFKWEYPLLSLRSSSSFLRLLPRLPVTSIPPFIFPSVTRCRKQFLRKMWPIQFAFRSLMVKKLLNVKCVFWSYLQLLSGTFLILRRIQRDIIINVHKSSCKVPLLLSDFNP